MFIKKRLYFFNLLLVISIFSFTGCMKVDSKLLTINKNDLIAIKNLNGIYDYSTKKENLFAEIKKEFGKSYILTIYNSKKYSASKNQFLLIDGPKKNTYIALVRETIKNSYTKDYNILLIVNNRFSFVSYKIDIKDKKAFDIAKKLNVFIEEDGSSIRISKKTNTNSLKNLFKQKDFFNKLVLKQYTSLKRIKSKETLQEFKKLQTISSNDFLRTKKLAELGDASEQYKLGYMYANGQQVKKDYKKAFKWYEKSALQGNSYAQNNLGVLYILGQGVKKNTYEALKWYKKSAKQGNEIAQKNLGDMYSMGTGVSKNNKKAIEWYKKSAAQGNKMAQQSLDDLMRKSNLKKRANKTFRPYQCGPRLCSTVIYNGETFVIYRTNETFKLSGITNNYERVWYFGSGAIVPKELWPKER